MPEHYPFTLRPLPYDYDALEPYIDTTTMYLHHNMHLATYVENLNKALALYPRYQSWSLTKLLYYIDQLPPALKSAVQKNGGGVYAHNLYFSAMSPNAASTQPYGKLDEAIARQFGGVNELLKQLEASASARFGSGWAWLVTTPSGKIKVVSTANQDIPFDEGCPFLLVDVWEHAYYLKYQNRRSDYLSNWVNTINWAIASERYASCIKK